MDGLIDHTVRNQLLDLLPNRCDPVSLNRILFELGIYTNSQWSGKSLNTHNPRSHHLENPRSTGRR